jgi:hypothetical protein
MLPTLPLVSVAIPPAINVVFGLMPMASAVILLVAGFAEILRAILERPRRRAHTSIRMAVRSPRPASLAVSPLSRSSQLAARR